MIWFFFVDVLISVYVVVPNKTSQMVEQKTTLNWHSVTVHFGPWVHVFLLACSFSSICIGVCKAQLWCWLETDSPNPPQTRRFTSWQSRKRFKCSDVHPWQQKHWQDQEFACCGIPLWSQLVTEGYPIVYFFSIDQTKLKLDSLYYFVHSLMHLFWLFFYLLVF